MLKSVRERLKKLSMLLTTRRVRKSSASNDAAVGQSEVHHSREAKSAFARVWLPRLFAASQWIQLKSAPYLKKVDFHAVRAGTLILTLSFISASAVSTFSVTLVMSVGKGNKKVSQDASLPLQINEQAKVGSTEGPSFSELSRNILARNLFNSDGTLAPEEVVESSDAKQTSTLDFETVPCSSEKLPVAVLGTIDTGNPFASYVTVKDQKVAYADTYKVGSLIIDYEDYEIYKVTRDQVEVRKGDLKICVVLNEKEVDKSAQKPGENPDASKAEVKPENIVNLEFTADELAQGIGPGYANILNSAKLIPAVEGGNVTGFKLISIKPDSLFQKMKFQNRDVVTEVNGVSLKDASEGFKLYQALQEEREITIRVLRDGTPMTFMVRVK